MNRLRDKIPARPLFAANQYVLAGDRRRVRLGTQVVDESAAAEYVAQHLIAKLTPQPSVDGQQPRLLERRDQKRIQSCDGKRSFQDRAI